jgi:multicomponent Na+:H+ antiporter subunit B
LGAIIGLGFLDNKILPLGTFGELLSAGIIPVIYSFIGLKVGAELSGIVETLSENQSEIEI